MKKFLAIAVIAATLTSCGGNENKPTSTEGPEGTSIDSTEVKRIQDSTDAANQAATTEAKRIQDSTDAANATAAGKEGKEAAGKEKKVKP